MIRTLIIQSSYDRFIELFDSKKDQIKEGGSCFVIFKSEYDSNGNVLHDFLDVINYLCLSGLDYVNTIVYPSKESSNVSFRDNVNYVIWFCKNKSKLYFNKDVVREKHIWKDVEWGKREKNYNSKGKDPGNVWIPTIDDGKAHITGHVLLTDNDVINKLVNMTDSANDSEIIREVSNYFNMSKEKSENNNSVRQNLFANVFFSSSECMKNVDNNIVKTIVTSPPYWNLKNYFKEGQIGQESYDKYVRRMALVWNECYNKLSENGSLWVNINIRVQNNKVIPIPYSIIQACKAIGFHYKGIIIWHKSSGIPAGPLNIGDHHEYILLFTKSQFFCVNDSVQKSIKDYKNDNINYGAFWNINRKAGSVGKKYEHPAIYPNELVSRIVLLSSQEYELILDPFLGSGTSLIAAVNENRSFVGYEYNEGFKQLMEDRFSKELTPHVIVNFE